MRDTRNAFHLAIPARDLDETFAFYVTGLGAHLARRYDDRITLDFFGDQVVCHLSPDEPRAIDLRLYPRHFGVTFRDHAEFEALVRLVKLRDLPVVAGPDVRFPGRAEEHTTLVLRDPTDNLLEFKHYVDPRMMF